VAGMTGGAASATVGAGPFAAGLAALYTAAVARAVLRRRRERADEWHHAAGLDAVAGLAADLRAGAPPQPALVAASAGLQHSPAAASAVSAAWQLSEQTGAPRADVLDRVEAR